MNESSNSTKPPKKRKRIKRIKRARRYLKKIMGHSLLARVVAFTFGILSLLLGIILLFIPGPGLLFLFLGFVFLSLLSPLTAKFLDKVEDHISDLYHKRKQERK